MGAGRVRVRDGLARSGAQRRPTEALGCQLLGAWLDGQSKSLSDCPASLPHPHPSVQGPECSAEAPAVTQDRTCPLHVSSTPWLPLATCWGPLDLWHQCGCLALAHMSLGAIHFYLRPSKNTGEPGFSSATGQALQSWLFRKLDVESFHHLLCPAES